LVGAIFIYGIINFFTHFIYGLTGNRHFVLPLWHSVITPHNLFDDRLCKNYVNHH
jgi:hypothetical protein